MRIVIYILRAFQLIFSIIILALAAQIVSKFNEWEKVCSALGQDECPNDFRDIIDKYKVSYEYSAFTGAWGIISVAFGLVALFVSLIPAIAIVVVDALTAIFYVAAGGRLAALLSGVDCDGDSICTRSEAICAFAWLGFIVALALIGLEVFRSKREGTVLMHSAV